MRVLARRALTLVKGVQEVVNKSAASAASPDSVKFQAVIKSAASAASLAEAALAADLITSFFSQFLAALAAKKIQKIVKISDSEELRVQILWCRKTNCTTPDGACSKQPW